MSPQEILRVAWAGIANNKLRSLLTMLGVIIGVAAVIIMMAVSAGTEAEIASQINSLGADLIFISPSMSGGGMGFRMPTMTYDDAVALASVSGVKGVSVEQSTTQDVRSEYAMIDDVTILGTTPDFPDVREVAIAEGRYFHDNEQERIGKVAVLGYGIAQDLFGSQTAVGEKITVGTAKLTVVGVMEQKGYVGNTDYDSRIYIPLSVIFQKFTTSRFPGERESVRMIYVQAESKDIMDKVITQVTIVLAKRHNVTVEAPDFTISTQQDIIDTQEATTASFRSLLGWVAGVSLLVGGIGIMNIMLVSVTERTREIGIRQAIGATPNDIRWQFLTEALILSLFGGLIGVLAGVGGAILFGATGGMSTVILPESIILAFSSAAFVGIFFGYVPANSASQLDPIDALRHE